MLFKKKNFFGGIYNFVNEVSRLFDFFGYEIWTEIDILKL